MFDAQDKVPYASIGREVIECEAHRQHARRMAQESMVLLKNDRSLLPLNASKLKRIAVIGPNADNAHTQLANYYGVPSEIVTPYKALQRRLGDKVKIDYYPGTGLVQPLQDAIPLSQLVAEAGKADVIVYVGGISADYEGEAGDAGADGYGGFASGDRTTLRLPSVQTELLKALKKTKRPLVVVNMSGSVMNFEWESKHADALLQAWYGGQAAGDAIVDVLLGAYNPAGRMPLTTYMQDSDLPAFEDYSMANRTYRYFSGKVRYPFGYGLSYTTFNYAKPVCASEVRTGDSVRVSTVVQNTGKCAGDEVVQLYVTHPENSNVRRPRCALKGFKRIHLKQGEKKQVEFVLSPEELAWVDAKGNLKETAEEVTIFVGGGQPQYAAGSTIRLKIVGDPYQVY